MSNVNLNSDIESEVFLLTGVNSNVSNGECTALYLRGQEDSLNMPVQTQLSYQPNLLYSLVIGGENYQLLDIEENRSPGISASNCDSVEWEPSKINNRLNDQKQSQCETRPVTHIEIIRQKPNKSKVKHGALRRVTGANRVVPMITNMWQKREMKTFEPSLTTMYKTVLDDAEECVCEFCHEQFLYVTQVEYHMKEVHLQYNVVSEQCFVCRKKYVSQSQLKNHLHVVHGIQCPELMCKICFMELNTAIEQKAHERKHDKVYSCQYCPTKFASEYFCQKHHEEHLVHIKPFQCSTCGKRFQNGISLSTHNIRHQNLKCLTCNAVFKKEVELLTHVKDHGNDQKQIFLDTVQVLDQEEAQLENMLNIYLKISSSHHSVTQVDKGMVIW